MAELSKSQKCITQAFRRVKQPSGVYLVTCLEFTFKHPCKIVLIYLRVFVLNCVVIKPILTVYFQCSFHCWKLQLY